MDEPASSPAAGLGEPLDPDGDKAPTSAMPTWARGLLALAALYLFISSVGSIGVGLKCVAKDQAGKEFLHWLFGLVSDPLTGVFIGLLVTSLVQSSSLTTSMTVGLVASGDVPLAWAIPIVMGANVGTSVTNLLVSMAHVRRRGEFRRALGGAVVHDFFNVLSVLVLLPLECAFGVISRLTGLIAKGLGGTSFFHAGAGQQVGLLKSAFGLVGGLLRWLLMEVLGVSPMASGAVIAGLALVILFVSLWVLVKMLRGLLQDRLSGMFSRSLFRNAGIAFTVGIITTAAVQSSSVTTSMVVPLVGAGILTLRQIYPYTLGANIGTTVTAILAALGTGSAAAMACAMGHLLFNVFGTVIFWPLQFIPISLAKGFARVASERRIIAVLFLIGLFFVLPIAGVVLAKLVLRW